MVPSRIAALLALVIPVGARAATDAPVVTVDESSVSSQATPAPAPAPLPVSPAAAAAPPPVPSPLAPPSAPAVESPGAVASVAPTRPLPGTGVGVELGYARGGDEFVSLLTPGPPGGATSVATIHGGDGIFVSLTGSWTPFWRERFGLGVYVSAGFKYADASSSIGSLSYTRYPVAAAAQVLVPASEKWFVLGRAGLLTELGAKVSGEGPGGVAGMTTNFATTVGGFADAGVQRAFGQHVAVAVLVRYTYLDVSLGGGNTSANNLAAGLGFCFSR